MLLEPQEAEKFFKLHRALMFFVNQRLQVLPGTIRDADEFSRLSPEQRLKVRDAFLDETDLIEKFIDENPGDFIVEELEIIKSWHELVAGDFFIFRYLKKYTVFLSSEKPPVAYGVLALTQPFEELVGPYLPVMTNTVLLPFKNRIIYDGLLGSYSISFGGGFRRSLKETYESAKQRLGIVTSLPVTDVPGPALKASKPKKNRLNLPQSGEVNEVLGLIVGMTDQFCREHLNDEYAILCRKLAEKLARKRPSPLLSGKPNTWACGIVRTIGLVNFLDDRSQNPHMKLPAIDRAFGVGESTGQGKSKLIRNLLKIRQFDHEWALPSRIDENPLIWMLEVNGFIQDIRDCPREIQKIAFEKGIIPYIPADRANKE
jgi:hypothetical protein